MISWLTEQIKIIWFDKDIFSLQLMYLCVCVCVCAFVQRQTWWSMRWCGGTMECIIALLMQLETPPETQTKKSSSLSTVRSRQKNMHLIKCSVTASSVDVIKSKFVQRCLIPWTKLVGVSLRLMQCCEEDVYFLGHSTLSTYLSLSSLRLVNSVIHRHRCPPPPHPLRYLLLPVLPSEVLLLCSLSLLPAAMLLPWKR